MLQKSQSSDSFLQTKKPVYEEGKTDNTSSQLRRLNPFYNDLSELMRDDRFRQVNRLYFNRWSDIEVFVLYVKLYDVIEMIMTDRHRDEVIDVIHMLMSHTESRRKLISLFQQFKEDDASFKDVVKHYVETQSNFLLPTGPNPSRQDEKTHLSITE
jgi:hypothetical protein